jgi:hypothetical protein
MKGVLVLRECQHTGCRNQRDAEANTGHPTDNGKSQGPRVEVYLENGSHLHSFFLKIIPKASLIQHKSHLNHMIGS